MLWPIALPLTIVSRPRALAFFAASERYDPNQSEPIRMVIVRSTNGRLALSGRFNMVRQGDPSHTSERGAVLVHVAFAFLALLAFTTFVVDWGVFWLARRQSQNAADSGATAAAMYMAWEGTGDPPGAQTMAVDFAQRNLVFGQAPDVTLSDVTFPVCPPGAPGPVDTCVRVNVFRNQRPGGNPLPIFFGSVVGLTDQGIQATATAQVVYPNATDCVKPFAIPDRWIEMNSTDSDGDGDNWDPDDTFDRYDKSGALLPNPDVYIPPTYGANGNVTNVGSGYRLPRDYGMALTLKAANQFNIAPSFYFPAVINPAENPGASRYRDDIGGCDTTPINPPWTLTNEPGNMVGPTRQGVDDQIALDPGAYWDPTIYNGPNNPPGGIAGGCMADGTCTISPRIAAVPVFNTEEYYQGQLSGRLEVQIVRILGFFFEPTGASGEVKGRFVTYPARLTAGTALNSTGSFLRAIILVR
jgi:Flp pilus assembly protein TadG